MAFDLATAKTRLGIVGTTQDVELQQALDTALAIAETYCDRKFLHQAETDTFTHVSGRSVSLKRYPLDADPTVTGDAKSYTFHADWNTGVIHFDSAVYDHKMTVTYTGGYTTLPADLEYALWGMFDAVWAGMQSAGAVAAGGVDKISLVGVGSISYDTSGAGGSTGSPLSDMARLALLPYRREWA